MRDGYSGLSRCMGTRAYIHGHQVCQHRASHESRKLTFHPSVVIYAIALNGIAFGEKLDASLPSERTRAVSRFPLKNTLYTLVQDGCQNRSKAVSVTG